MEIKQQLVHGAQLADHRDTGKRKFEDMSAAEQQILEDFETEKTEKEYNKLCVRKPARMHWKML